LNSQRFGVEQSQAVTRKTPGGPPAPGHYEPRLGPSFTCNRFLAHSDLASAGRGVITVNTPQTKALLGFVTNRVWNLGELTLTPGSNQLGWCTLGATLTRGSRFTNDCTALVVAGGWWENTGQVWKDASKDSVGNQWGGPPILVEVVPFTLSLPVSTNRISAWALDERGQRKSSLAITGTATNATITVGANTASIWYEIEVARYLAGFDLWRSTNFTTAELANPAVSGDRAAPAGDGVANLLKYYMGLPAKTVAPPARLPQGALRLWNGGLHLAMSYAHDKTVADVLCVPDVSPDLLNWSSGLAHTANGPPEDMGTLERLIAYDLTPAGGASMRFMRLRFWRPAQSL